MSKKKGKTISMIDKNFTRLSGKSYFISSVYTVQLLDSNYSGDLFFSVEDRKNLLQKWEFILEDSPNFLIKNAASGFYLGSDLIGSLNCSLLTSSPFQRWKLNACSGIDTYVITNSGSNCVLDVFEKSETIYINYLGDRQDLKSTQLFKIFTSFTKK